MKMQHGGTATLCVKSGNDFVRVSTNVLKDDETRAAGTPLAKNKTYETVSKGETFCGDIEILGNPYTTCFEPIKNAKTEIIGIYYVRYQK
ncbi:MAG: Cache 3/Cache 2 fusion domain-containing protein [Pseudobdellovibrionaceae bacterium]